MHAQHENIAQKTYAELVSLIDSQEVNSPLQKRYIDLYIQKARSENNNAELIDAYRKKMFRSPESTQLAYADSIYQIALASQDNKLISIAYQTYGTVYFLQKNYKVSVENSLKAEEFILKTNDLYTLHKIRYSIADVKYYLGSFQDALEIYQECATYYKSQNNINSLLGYINSIRSISKCYYQLGEYQKSSYYNNLGLEACQLIKNKTAKNNEESYFRQSEGIVQYALKNYESSLSLLEGSLEGIRNNKDYTNEHLTYLFLGKNYWELGEREKALEYFESVDELYRDKKITNLDLRQAYVFLIDYYKAKKNLEKQLDYTNVLIQIDSLLREDYKFLNNYLHTEYDNKNLYQYKEELQQQIETNKKRSLYLYIAGLLVIVGIGITTVIYYRKQRLYRKKYEALLHPITLPKATAAVEISAESEAEAEAETADVNSAKSVEIHEDIVKQILWQLERFEADKEYLKQNITQTQLAELWKTNTSYLSKVINTQKNKNFNQYVNDLRIEYGVELLRTNTSVRSYKISSIASELGFTNTRSFTNAFTSRTGLKPSYFIEQLNKDHEA
ncbi:helix-turn-helix domain-containing protein [Flavobacterium sp. JP2137]|uniref:helix-turn-helix domain-containing protein n=1 Tax=Flavobacterium sp. JP2137 TaxID=3414510 RepID=UPI003D2FDF80